MNELDQRSGKVMDFINGIEKNRENQNQMAALNNDPTIKYRKMAAEQEKGENVCLDTIFAKLYKNALPLDDTYKDSHDSQLDSEVHDYIMRRSDGKGPKFYVHEALIRNKSPKLKRILEAAKDITSSYYHDKADKLSDINIEDLNYRMTDDQMDSINKLVNDLEFDDVADIISSNVKKTALDEIARAKAEKASQQKLEEELANNDDIKTEAALHKELAMRRLNEPTVYQPSLFEAVLMSKTINITESGIGSGDEVFGETVKEYTLLSMSKALMLESFDINTTKKLTANYLLNR